MTIMRISLLAGAALAILPVAALAQEAPSLIEFDDAAALADAMDADQNAVLLAIQNDPAASAIQVGRANPDAVRDARALSLALPVAEAEEAPGTDGEDEDEDEEGDEEEDDAADDAGDTDEAGAGGTDEVAGAVDDPGPTDILTLDDLVVESRSDENYSLASPPDAEDVQVNIVVMGEDVVGSILRDGELFKIQPLGDGLTAIYRYDTSVLEDHPPNWEEFMEEEMQREAPPDQFGPPPTAADTGAIIDVLIAYTPTAATETGNINATIQLVVDEWNQAYANSGINPRVRLVHSYQTAYTQDADMGVDLSRLRGTSDGFMDEVHARRDQHRADLVMLLIGRSNYCGIAYFNASAENAFGVTAQNCATGYYTPAHEAGHNQGAHHDPAAGTNSPFPYGHGFCNTAGGWRTVMSYNSNNCGNRRQNFSNPNVSIGGTPTGDALLRNNARVINETAFRVANFRQSLPPTGACRPGFREAGARMCVSSNVLGPSTYANALVNCMDQGARVASYGDLRYLYVRTSFDAAYNPNGRWIGDFVGDDTVLCGNRTVTSDNDPNIGNFEGTCNRFDNRGFWCAYDR